MSTYENMREQIMRRPTAKNIMPEELQSFLNRYGFVLKRSHGSHFIYEYRRKDESYTIVIPMHSPIKPAYIDQIRDIILTVEATKDDEL